MAIFSFVPESPGLVISNLLLEHANTFESCQLIKRLEISAITLYIYT